jgi:putative DNA primase/helicase
VPFEITIPIEERDKTLPAKLQAEMSGILNWALQGCREWQESGLRPPQEVLAATTEYREESDVLADFLKECCIQSPTVWASAKDLYGVYTSWCEDMGEKKPLSQRAFGTRLRERGLWNRKNSAGRKEWVGIGLDLTDDSDHKTSKLAISGALIGKSPEKHPDHPYRPGIPPIDYTGLPAM